MPMKLQSRGYIIKVTNQDTGEVTIENKSGKQKAVATIRQLSPGNNTVELYQGRVRLARRGPQSRNLTWGC